MTSQQQPVGGSEQQYIAYHPPDYANAPALPPRPGAETVDAAASSHLQPSGSNYAAPPQRPNSSRNDSDINSPVHYTRDPHKLVAYLVPFPKPRLNGVPTENIPPRFLIYTPPPPPLTAPKEGEKEGKIHKIQRKWEEEVRAAKTSDAKTMSWKGAKSKATRGINKAMSFTKTSNLEFLTRVGGNGEESAQDKHAEDAHSENDETHKTVGLEDLVLVYPSDVQSSPEQMRQEFIDNLCRAQSKAQKDAIIATGLLPVSLALDVRIKIHPSCSSYLPFTDISQILFTVVWPFGGLLEIDGVWAAASIKGAKTSRSMTKRITSSSKTGKHDEDTLHLNFVPSSRIEILQRYLTSRCHERDANLFPACTSPTETDVLEAIGWSPSQHDGQERNWEDEQWETMEVKDDLKMVMTKAAKEWDSWVKAYEKNPEKAMKK